MSKAETPSEMSRDRLVSRNLNGEVLVYDPDTQRAHCLQPVAAAVWRGSNGSPSRERLMASIAQDLGAPVSDEQVDQAIAELGEAGLLPLPDPESLAPSGLGRREALQRIGLVAAAMAPLVTTILLPTPAQASTCLGPGSACTSSSQCCSGLCQSNLTCA